LEFASGTPGGACVVDLALITGTTYTLELADCGKYLRCNNASGVVVTVPLNSTAAFSMGSVVSFEQTGAGAVTVTGETTGVILNAYDNGFTTAGKYAGMQIIKVDTDSWTCIAGV
jgi:hypothetical protein